MCPFSATTYNALDPKVIKTDLCDGDPQCARFCEVQAIEYVSAADVSIDIKRDAALRLKEAGKKAEGLQASL